MYDEFQLDEYVLQIQLGKTLKDRQRSAHHRARSPMTTPASLMKQHWRTFSAGQDVPNTADSGSIPNNPKPSFVSSSSAATMTVATNQKIFPRTGRDATDAGSIDDSLRDADEQESTSSTDSSGTSKKELPLESGQELKEIQRRPASNGALTVLSPKRTSSRNISPETLTRQQHSRSSSQTSNQSDKK